MTPNLLRHFGFDLHPDVVSDLDTAPAEVRGEALGVLYRVMRGHVRGRPLETHVERDLAGCRKLYLADSEWRAVYVETHRTTAASVGRGVLLLAVGPRLDHAVYNTAAQRLDSMRLRPNGPSAGHPTNPARLTSIRAQPMTRLTTAPASLPRATAANARAR